MLKVSGWIMNISLDYEAGDEWINRVNHIVIGSSCGSMGGGGICYKKNIVKIRNFKSI